MLQIRDLVAQEAIRSTLHRYCRAADRCDWPQFADVFHDDAVIDHGEPMMKHAFVEKARERVVRLWESTQHMLGQIHIELDGASADSEAYLIAHHVTRREPGADGRRLVAFGGRYVDRFEERGGEWRIARRVLVKDWHDDRLYQPATGWQFRLQRRDRSDPVYRPDPEDALERG
jgi:hypothetical protein